MHEYPSTEVQYESLYYLSDNQNDYGKDGMDTKLPTILAVHRNFSDNRTSELYGLNQVAMQKFRFYVYCVISDVVSDISDFVIF